MRSLFAFFVLVAAACGGGPRTRDALQPRAPAALAVEPCSVLGDTDGGRTCRLYDTKAKAFAAAPDPLALRAYLYERWLERYQTVEGQVVERVFDRPMAPGEPEAAWADDKRLASFDDLGDSASYFEELGLSAAFRYATTGLAGDRLRLEATMRHAVLDFEATGMDGYLARGHFAGVPAGTPLRNGLSLGQRDPGDALAFDIPAEKLPLFPAYYRDGLDGVPTRPSWYGAPSIDTAIGPLNSFPVAYSLVGDPALKASMARHYGCFLKRLRLFRVVGLSQNAALQADLSRLLTAGAVHFDAGDPDLAHQDELTALYLPQYNAASAPGYARDCPAAPAFEADPRDLIDVSQPGWDGKLADLLLRLSPGGAKAMDLEYFPTVRAGDAVLLLSHALAAWHLTRDPVWLRWRDELLIGRLHADRVARTFGVFEPPKACRSYYRGPAVYTALFVQLLLDNDAAGRAQFADIWKSRLAAREMAELGDGLFAVMAAAAVGERGAALQEALAQLASFGGAADALDSPRRDYAVDARTLQPPGISIGPPPAAEVQLCEAGFTLLGLHLPGSTVDPADRFADRALPWMARPPNGWLWGRDPFLAAIPRGAPGTRQWAGVDLTEPYWIARFIGALPDPQLTLAWDG